MSYSQALEQQVLALRGLGSPAGKGLIDAMMDDAKYDAEARSEYWNFLCRGLAEAEPYYWAPNMCELIRDTARSMPSWTFKAGGLPSRSGFFWFAKPIAMQRDGEWQGDLKAISWFGMTVAQTAEEFAGYEPVAPGSRVFLTGADRPGTPGICVFFWSDYGRLTGLPFGAPVTSYILKDGTTLGEIDAYNASHFENGRDRRMEKVSILATALGLIGQQILVTHAERPARSTLRRLVAQGITAEPTVQVVRLRKQVQPEHERAQENGAVEWSCSWVVRGHWRQQACGPNYSERRPVFVLPYVKGDTDKPLKPLADRVFAVVR